MKEKINLLLTLLKQKKEYFFIAIPFGAVLLFAIFTIIFFSTSSNRNTTQHTSTTNNTFQPTSFSSPYQIIKTSPESNAINVGLYEPVSATFSKPISSSDQQKISFSFSPEVTGTTEWSADRTIITFTPSDPFLNEQLYTVTLSLGSSPISSWQFTIVSAENMSKQDSLKAQQQAEDDYKNLEQQFYQKFPWYDSLPLQTDNYFVYFDTDTNELTGILYPNTQSNTSVADQVNTIKSEIVPQLKNLGIDTNQYPVNWEVTPEVSPLPVSQ